jgi:hypothetical protein
MTNVNMQLKKGVMTPDGKWFATTAEARDYLRAPLIQAALKKVANGDTNLAKFLLDNEDEIMKCFEAGTVARVTKAEKNRLKKALDHLCTIDDTKLRFIQENADAVLESFRWPSVKRLTAEEKAAATLEGLTKLSDANAAKWIVANRAAIEDAYEAGIEKRVAPPSNGLAEYQAAKKAGPEALAAYNAEREAKKAAAKAAAKKAA